MSMESVYVLLVFFITSTKPVYTCCWPAVSDVHSPNSSKVFIENDPPQSAQDNLTTIPLEETYSTHQNQNESVHESENPNEALTEDKTGFIDSDCVYHLKDSTRIYREKESIIVDSSTCQANPFVAFPQYKKRIYENYFAWPFDIFNGLPVKKGILLFTSMSENDFLFELIRCGLYEPTPEQQEHYVTIGNWSKEFRITSSLVVGHYPDHLEIKWDDEDKICVTELECVLLCQPSEQNSCIKRHTLTTLVTESRFYNPTR